MVGNVLISHQALEQVFTDSVEASGIEVGGLLVGYLEKGEVHITGAIPTSQGSYTRIPIQPIEIARAAEKLNPGEQIAGWYHSHPGHGVFFSQEDIESHERFLEFNSNFKALVIDPIQAKRGDPLADCVKFYTVEKGKTLIYDYRLTNSSGHHYYDPEDFVFDRNGFAHYRPSIRGGITEADERGIRQTLGDLKSEKDKLEENYLRLEKRWKSSVNIPKKAFPFLLVLLVSTGGLLGLILGVVSQEKGVVGPSIEDLNETINITEASFDWKSTQMVIKVDFSKSGIDTTKLQQKKVNIEIYLCPDPTGNSGQVITSSLDKIVPSGLNIYAITVTLENGSSDYNLLGTHKYVKVMFTDPNGTKHQSKAISLDNEYYVEIQGTPTISGKSLNFDIVLYGPACDAVPPFFVHLTDLMNTQHDELLIQYPEEEDEKWEFIQRIQSYGIENNIITVSLEMKPEKIDLLRGKFFYVVIQIWGQELKSTPPVKIS